MRSSSRPTSVAAAGSASASTCPTSIGSVWTTSSSRRTARSHRLGCWRCSALTAARREQVADIWRRLRQPVRPLLGHLVGPREPALMLAQVLGPRRDEVRLDEPARLRAVTVEPPAERPGALGRAAYPLHDLDELLLVLLGDQ